MYDDWMTMISSMTEQQAGELIKSIAAYRLGTEYTPTDPTVLVILPMITSRLKADDEKYAERCRKNAENGRRGGKQKHANACERYQTLASASHNETTTSLYGMFQSDRMTKAMNTWIDARSQIGVYPYAAITQTLSMAREAEKKHGVDKCVALIAKATAGGWKAIPWDELDGKTDNKKQNTWGRMENNEYDWENFEAQILGAQERDEAGNHDAAV